VDTIEIIVIALGILAVVIVLWWFFGERETVAAEVRKDGVQEIDITVKGGYSPDVIAVKKGVPVKLNFFRDETSSCSEQVVIGDLGIARDLPAYKTTAIEFTPDRTGEFPFTCGMNMLHGKLKVS
jgi:plastocyanin domain-containing protein